jgi:hypothetical protein
VVCVRFRENVLAEVRRRRNITDSYCNSVGGPGWASYRAALDDFYGWLEQAERKVLVRPLKKARTT